MIETKQRFSLPEAFGFSAVAAMATMMRDDVFGRQSRLQTTTGETMATGAHHHPPRTDEEATETLVRTAEEVAAVAIHGTISIPGMHPSSKSSRNGGKAILTTTLAAPTMIIGLLLLGTFKTTIGVLPAIVRGGNSVVAVGVEEVVVVVEEAAEMTVVEAADVAEEEGETSRAGEVETSNKTLVVAGVEAAAKS
jgi:hypothetical protein